jgi:vacuolar protein sorting-associated protein 35
MKDILPDKGSQYEGEGGDVHDAVDFILKNMSEMNRLWVRL